LTINYDTSFSFIGLPAGLCDSPSVREVGPNAVVKKAPHKKGIRNAGDPDESFFIQTTSKAVGNIGSSTTSQEHFKWQYWAWTPIRSSFPASVGTLPPLISVDNAHLVAVTSAVYASASNVYTVQNLAINFKVVSLTVHAVTSPSTFFSYVATDFTPTALVAPSIKVFDNTTASGIPNTALPKGSALSIYIVSLPSPNTAFISSNPKSLWFTVSLWVSTIQKET